MAYMHGNLAYQPEKERQEQYRETREVVTKRHALPAGEKFLYLFTIIACVAVAGAVMWKYTQIYEVNTKMQQIQQQIDKLNEENDQLKVDARKAKDPKRLIEEGKALGLIPSDDETVKEISPDKVYYASTDDGQGQ